MKTAILTPTFSRFSGPDRVVLNEATEAAAKGDTVTVFTFKTDFDFPDLQKKGISVEVLGMPRNGFIERIYRLLFFFDVSKVIKIVNKLQQYDEVISFLYPMTIPATIAKRRYKQQLRYVYYDVGIAYPQLFESFLERLYMKIFAAFTKTTIKNADAAISISKFLSNGLKRETGLESKVKYVRIDTARFNKNTVAKYRKQIAAVMKKHSLKKPVLLYVGRISPHKGVHLLLQAFRIIRKNIPAATLIVAGKPTFPKYYSQLQETAKEIGGVVFAGFVPDEEMPAYYGMCDVYVTCSLWEGFDMPVCLLPDSKIKCENGFKTISELRTEEKVTTHTGKESRIIATSKRHYNGKIKQISVYGCNTPLELTPKHKVLAIKTKKCKTNNICKPSHNCRKKYFLDYKPEWIEAGMLTKGDALLYPYQRKTKDYRYLNSQKYVNDAIAKDSRIFYKYSRKTESGKESYESAGRQLGLSKNAVYRYVNGIKSQLSTETRRLIQAHLRKISFKPREKISIPSKIAINGDFLRLFGYYLSEGHPTKTKSTLTFTFNAKEKEYHEDVLKLMERIFGIEGQKRIQRNGCHINFTTKLVNVLFANLGSSGAKNKYIPQEFITLPNQKLKELIKGLWRGDGSIVTGKRGYTLASFSTISPKLAEQTREILFKLGIPCNIQASNREHKNIEYSLNVTGAYKQALCKILGVKCANNKERTSHNRYWLDERYFYAPIRKIEELNYNGFVHNLEVEGDNSYTTLQGTVHNCEANACGKPAVAFNVGSHPEVLKEGKLVKEGDVAGFAAAVIKLLGKK